jgi:hypothetical protein
MEALGTLSRVGTQLMVMEDSMVGFGKAINIDKHLNLVEMAEKLVGLVNHTGRV